MKPIRNIHVLSLLAVVGLVGGCARASDRPSTPHVFSASGGAEQTSECQGLASNEISFGLLSNKHLVTIERLEAEHRIGARNVVRRPSGARVIVAAEPTISAAHLERIAQCHLAIYRLGGGGDVAASEPLAVDGANVEVKPVFGGYAVEITADGWEAAEEIYSRAKAKSVRQ